MRVLAQQADQPADGNPYIPLLYASMPEAEVTPLNRRRLLHRWDVVHVHWPEQVIRWDAATVVVVSDVLKMLGGFAVARARGARLVWTGHDLGPHDMPRPRLYSLYIRAFGRMVDLLISLSDDATQRLRETHPWLQRVPVALIRHGHYRDAYPALPPADQAREILALPHEPTFLLLGQIRRYKNVPALIEGFAPRRGRLLVAGRVIGDDALADEIRSSATAAGNVTLRLGLVPSADVPLLHAASDVVVLPYSMGTALHSGAAFLALSLGRPVVVRDSGTMRELQSAVGAEWVGLFTGGVADALDEAELLAASARVGAPDLSTMEWAHIGRETSDAFATIVRRRRHR